MFQCERVNMCLFMYRSMVWVWMCVATVCVFFHSLTHTHNRRQFRALYPNKNEFYFPTKINIYINRWKIKSGIDIKKSRTKLNKMTQIEQYKQWQIDFFVVVYHHKDSFIPCDNLFSDIFLFVLKWTIVFWLIPCSFYTHSFIPPFCFV